ncbi:MAG: hypothetical protein ACR2K0_02245 [Acidimicrobiales bacterium]
MGDFDAAGLWDLDGATSMTAWLCHPGAMAGGDARGLVSSARRLRGLSVTALAALDGRLSAGQVKAIVANVSDATAELFAEHEAKLVPTLVDLSVADTTRAMRWWAAQAEATVDDGKPQGEPESSLYLSSTSVVAGPSTATSAPSMASYSTPPCAWPAPLTSTVRPPAPRRSAGPRPWPPSAGSFWSATTTPSPPATAPAPTSSCAWTTWRPAGAASSPMAWCSTPVPRLSGVRLGLQPGADGGLVDPRLRELDPHRLRPPVQRLGGARPVLSLPRL